MKTFCGIDIGLKGGVAVIDENGSILKLFSMPIKLNQQGKDEVDSLSLYKQLQIGHLSVCIEALKSFGNEGRASLWSFGTSNGKTRAVLEILGYSHIVVDPKIWKADVLKGTSKDKKAAIGWCLQKWPSVNLKEDSSQYKDGLADALCLAEFCRRQALGGS